MFIKLNSNQEKQQQQIDLQILFNALTLSVIVSSAFGADLEINTHANDIMCKVLTETLDAVVYRTMHMINQIGFFSKLLFSKGI